VQAGDRVDVAPAVHVPRFWSRPLRGARQAISRRAQPGAARRFAGTHGDVSADVRRRSLDRLGRLEHEAGDLDAAASLLAEAADEFDVAPPATRRTRGRLE
jgi:hypothetical protein